MPVLGIEPTANTAQVAIDKGIPTRVEFFGRRDRALGRAETQADLLLGNNVLAHVPDINDFVAGMAIAAARPAARSRWSSRTCCSSIELNQWDTIYHEHYSYLSFATVQRRSSRRTACGCSTSQELPTHGGSLRIFGCHADDDARADRRRGARCSSASAPAGLERRADVPRLRRARRRRQAPDRLDCSSSSRRRGLSIAGYGAPAKGNTLLNYCGVGRDFIDFTVRRQPAQAGPRPAGHAHPDPRARRDRASAGPTSC